jgi:hypothetical protein
MRKKAGVSLEERPSVDLPYLSRIVSVLLVLVL